MQKCKITSDFFSCPLNQTTNSETRNTEIVTNGISVGPLTKAVDEIGWIKSIEWIDCNLFWKTLQKL